MEARNCSAGGPAEVAEDLLEVADHPAHGQRQGVAAFGARGHRGSVGVRKSFSQIVKEDFMGQLSQRRTCRFRSLTPTTICTSCRRR